MTNLKSDQEPSPEALDLLYGMQRQWKAMLKGAPTNKLFELAMKYGIDIEDEIRWMIVHEIMRRVDEWWGNRIEENEDTPC